MKMTWMVFGMLVAGELFGGTAARVGVVVGDRADGISMGRWLQLASRLEDAEPVCVDGAAIRAGALEGLDLVVIPDVNWKALLDDLGAVGAEKLKAHVRAGGACVANGGGCRALM